MPRPTTTIASNFLNVLEDVSASNRRFRKPEHATEHINDPNRHFCHKIQKIAKAKIYVLNFSYKQVKKTIVSIICHP